MDTSTSLNLSRRKLLSTASMLVFTGAASGCLSFYKENKRCPVCGMPVGIYDGPKGKIVFRGEDTLKFCSTADMFQVLTQPKFNFDGVDEIQVQDIGETGWKSPEGNWIPAGDAHYVAGSNRKAAMGGTFVTFQSLEEAQAFQEKYGGTILAYDRIDTDTVKKYTRFG